MPWFKCFIHGENFPGGLINETAEVGFYTTRFVEAGDRGEAEKVALSSLRKEPKLQLPDGVNASENIKVFFEEIVEVASDEVPDVVEGFSWYVEGT